MINDFENVLFKWLYPCPYFQSLFVAHASLVDGALDGQTVISPDVMGVDDVYLVRCMRKQGKKRYTLNIAQFNTLISVANTDQNIAILDVTKKLQAWVQEQIEKENYPDIGYEIIEMDATGVSIASVSQNGDTKVQFQIIIDYYYRP